MISVHVKSGIITISCSTSGRRVLEAMMRRAAVMVNLTFESTAMSSKSPPCKSGRVQLSQLTLRK